MLSQKENSFLKDLRGAEQICINKYNKYASDAQSSQLKSLFQQIGSHEQQHLQTIDQIISGNTPASMSSSQSSQSSQGSQQQTSAASQASNQYANNSTAYNNDSYLCSDALSTEKHVSSIYDTSIFEFKNTAVRDALNHIQKEEQQHGEMIYNYMSSNGMYN